MEIEDLYRAGKYTEIVDGNLQHIYNTNLQRGKPSFLKKFEETKYILFSCFYLGYYNDCLKLLKKLTATVPVSDSLWKPFERANLAKISFFSLLYALFNREEIFPETEVDISSEIDKTLEYLHPSYEAARLQLDSGFQRHIDLYNDFKQGKQPFYSVKFLYPYEPPFGEYTFNLKQCTPYITLKVCKVPRDSDCYTSFEFVINGYTNADTFWKGPAWEHRERFPAVRKVLPLLNLIILLAAEATPGKFVAPYCIEQVSSVELAQYAYDGSAPIHSCLGTDFTAHWVGGNAPKRKLSNEELSYLNDRINAHYGAKHFVTLFHQAKNNISAGLYAESFLLFCICVESMLYHWCGVIADLSGKRKEYDIFCEKDISPCDSCNLYKQSKEAEKPSKGQKPNTFRHIKWLQDECGVSKADAKKLRGFIDKARNNQLRNDIVHGRDVNVTLANVNEAEKYIFMIQDIFQTICEKCTRTHQEGK